MTRPPAPLLTISPPMSLVQRNVLVRFKSRMRCQSARNCSSIGTLTSRPPTLLMRMSIRPGIASASRQADSHSSGTPMSARIVNASRPRALTFSAVSARESASRPVRITSAPASASASTISRPRPRLPPVMKRRRPARENRSRRLMMVFPSSQTHSDPPVDPEVASRAFTASCREFLNSSKLSFL